MSDGNSGLPYTKKSGGNVLPFSAAGATQKILFVFIDGAAIVIRSASRVVNIQRCIKGKNEVAHFAA